MPGRTLPGKIFETCVWPNSNQFTLIAFAAAVVKVHTIFFTLSGGVAVSATGVVVRHVVRLPEIRDRDVPITCVPACTLMAPVVVLATRANRCEFISGGRRKIKHSLYCTWHYW